MGDHQGRPGAVNLGPFVGVDLNMWQTVYSRYCAYTDVKWINQAWECHTQQEIVLIKHNDMLYIMPPSSITYLLKLEVGMNQFCAWCVVNMSLSTDYNSSWCVPIVSLKLYKFYLIYVFLILQTLFK